MLEWMCLYMYYSMCVWYSMHVCYNGGGNIGGLCLPYVGVAPCYYQLIIDVHIPSHSCMYIRSVPYCAVHVRTILYAHVIHFPYA